MSHPVDPGTARHRKSKWSHKAAKERSTREQVFRAEKARREGQPVPMGRTKLPKAEEA